MHKRKRSGPAVPDNFYSSRRSSSRQSEIQDGLLMLFNCNITDPFHGQYVSEALGSMALLWPGWLYYMKMVARRELAVPLAAGYTTANRCANVLVIQLMHVRFRCYDQHYLLRPLELCNAEKSDTGPLRRFYRSSVSSVMSNINEDPFRFWPPRAFWGIDRLVDLRSDMQHAITEALRNAAVALQGEITRHKDITGLTRSKNYERDSERAIETLKNLQLYQLNNSTEVTARRLASCPLQLGYADMNQWIRANDCCNRKQGITGLADVLNSRCRCGLISFKRRSLGKSFAAPPIPDTEWVGVLTHQLKEEALQRFFRGSVYMQVSGRLIVAKTKAHNSMVFLDEPSKNLSRPLRIQHHLCVVCSEKMENSRVLQCLRANSTTHSQRLSLVNSNMEDRERNCNEMLSHNEFHLCSRWEGIRREVLCLEKASSFDNANVKVFVGEYVGPEHFAIQALQASRKNTNISAALRGLLGQHARDDMMAHPSDNPIHNLNVQHLNKVLQKQNMQVSSEMIPVVEKWSQSTSGCLALAAAPGAGKSIMSASALVAKIEELKPNECVVVLCKKRLQRNARLMEVRSLAQDPLSIIGLGRALDGSADQGDEEGWDDEVSKFLNERLSSKRDVLRGLKKELEEYKINEDMETDAGAEWKRITEKMHALSMKLYAAKLAAWEEITSNMKAVSMTVDGFLQSLSKGTVLNSLMAGKKFVWAIIDEAHQLDFKIMAAVASQVSGILILYDKAQEIQHQRHCNMKEDVVPVKNDDCYFWPRSIYGGSQVPVWHCLRKEDISEMPYSFRFGLRVVNFLRKTSMYYIQNKEAIASPMENPKSFSSEELARVPETKIRIVNYQK